MDFYPEQSQEVDDEELKRVHGVWERFEEQLNQAFLDPEIDWIIVGENTGVVFRTRTAGELPTLKDFAELLEKSEEPLLILGRTVYIDGASGGLSC